METPRSEPPTAPQATTHDADLALLIEAVRDAGALALSYFGQGPEARLKPDGTQVSDADLAVDAELKSRLTGARPAYGWLSEETADDGRRLETPRVWIVDPIDGTRAFLKEHPEWTVAAALVEHGQPVLAAVYNPPKDEFFWAARGAGAHLNDRRIHVSDRSELAGCRLFAARNLFRRDIWQEPWPEVETVWVNSIAYRLALVAAGRGEGTLSLSRKSDWDLAAADLLVHEAGGIVTTRAGEALTYNRPRPEHDSVVAAGPLLHPAVIERTRSARP
ncbi:MAG: inositol monophosphatase family protein [Methyloligellaceae bacterium]